MHADRWLRHPVLPRPPAVPNFGPELRALIGLERSDPEKDPIPSSSSPRPVEPESAASSNTRPDALVPGERTWPHAIRAGT